MTAEPREGVCPHCGTLGVHRCAYHELDLDDVLDQLRDWIDGANQAARNLAKEGRHDLVLLAAARRYQLQDVRDWIRENR